ncbi:DUF421 domain-containing protein [Pseudomonas asuensis]|jgi:uncharacterized membrane protein YcaP (DUF421 family)|uniref:DUF421 domain-containing protein n=1 Tax=Pseudomonas asuensis TaxID=1825787 RepID=A0ABQ2GVU3_9PSED|nr:YetF domain-containing protein [Pseudomonas asuensis]GGM16147.1 DUF421 domain-containing protein [Pseudomonas asuensis]
MFFDSWSGLIRVIVVGTAAYIGLIALLRISGKRTLAQLNAFDFVVTVALGSTLATVLLSSSVALAEGLTAFALLIGLQYIVTWSSVRWPVVRKLARSSPSLLVYQGAWVKDNLESNRVTEDEVMQALRKQGKSSLSEIGAVVLETDGSFSILQSVPEGGL